MYIHVAYMHRTYTLAKARETYGLNTLLMYAKEERFAGRPTKRTCAIYETLLKNGAAMGFHAGGADVHVH